MFHSKGARRLFSTAWAFALLALATFSASAQSISVSPTSGTVGSLVTVTGSRYTANQSVGQLWVGDSIAIDSSAHLLSATVGTVSGNNIAADANGAFTVTFRMPVVVGGEKEIRVSVRQASAWPKFTVKPGIVRFSPLSVKFGDKMTIVANGFKANEKVKVYFGTNHVQNGDKEIQANSNGQINGQITVGAAPYADGSTSHPLLNLEVRSTAQGTTDKATRATAVGISPYLKAQDALGKKVGETIKILAHGFPQSTDVNLEVGRTANPTLARADANGSLQGKDADTPKEIALPAISFGQRDLVLKSGNAVSRIPNGLSVVPSIDVDATKAGVGTDFILTLKGFAHYKSVNSVNVIQTDNTGDHTEAVTIDLVQNGSVVAANIHPIDAAADAGADDTGRITAAYTLSASHAAGLSSGVAALRATGSLSNRSAEVVFFYSSPADSPRLFVVEKAGSTEMVTDFAPGATVYLVGTSFAANDNNLGALSMVSGGRSVTLTTNPNIVRSDAKGLFLQAVSATIPANTAGGVWTLSFADAPTATATINIVPGAPAVTPGSATVGTDLTVSGSGFLPNETVTFRISPTTFVSVTDGSNTDTDNMPGAVRATVRLADSKRGAHEITAQHSRGTTKGPKLTVQSEITHVDGLARDRDNAPTYESVTKRLGGVLSVAGTGQTENSELQLWLDIDANGAQSAGDIQLDTRKATSNVNGSYNITADLTSVNVPNLAVAYQVILVDPVDPEDPNAKITVTVPVRVTFDSSFAKPIGAHVSEVKSKEGNIWVRGIAYQSDGTTRLPGKNFGYLLLDGVSQDLGDGTTSAADAFVEGGTHDKDSTSGSFLIQIPTPELANGLHTLTLDGQTVTFNVTHRAVKAAGPGNNRVKVGDSSLKVTAYGFRAGETVQVKIDNKVVGSGAANTKGTAENITLTIADSILAGTYPVVVEGVSSGAKVDKVFDAHVLPVIQLSPDHGRTTDVITVTGKGFRANEGIGFFYGGHSISGVVTANANGQFTHRLNVPSASFDKNGRPLMATGNVSRLSASAQFTLFADLRLADDQLLQVGSGTSVTVVGDGFQNGESIKFKIAGQSVKVGNADITARVKDDGTFTQTMTLPKSKGGIQTIRAEATTGSRQIAQLTVNVTSSLTVNSGSPGTVGAELRAQANGFEGGAVSFYIESVPGVGNVGVGIHGDDTKHKRNHVGANGSTQAVRIYIPTIPRGTWTLVAKDGVNDPLTGAKREARTKITVLPRVTKINGEGNPAKWPKKTTARNSNGSFKTFTVEGNGFEAGSTISVKHTNDKGAAFDVVNNTVKANGTFNLTGTLKDLASGAFPLYVSDSKGGVPTERNALEIGPEISLSTTSGVAGSTQLTIRGSGFAPGAVTYTFENGGGNVFTGTSSATSTDTLATVQITGTLSPTAPSGYQKLIARDSLGNTGSAHILVSLQAGMQLTVNKTAAKVGDTVTVVGTGYTGNGSYRVTFGSGANPNSVTIKSTTFGEKFGDHIKADEHGSFRFEAPLPNAPKGPNQALRVGQALALISITEKISVTPPHTGVQEGQKITINGTGFDPSETLAVALKITSGSNPTYYYTQTSVIRDDNNSRKNEGALLSLGTDTTGGGVIYSGNSGLGNGFRAGAYGNFTATLTLPGIPLGDYRVEAWKMNTAKGQSFDGNKGRRPLTGNSNTFRSSVKERLAISSSTIYNNSTGVGGSNNGQLFVSGAGFMVGQDVVIAIPGWSQRVTPDADGYINATVTVGGIYSGAQFGTHDIKAESQGADYNNFKKHGFHDAQNKVSVQSEIVVTPASIDLSITGSQKLTVHGFGFGNDNRRNKNDEQVRFIVDDEVVDTNDDEVVLASPKGIVGNNGRFTYEYTIPEAIKAGKNLTGVPGGAVVVRAEGHSTGGKGSATDTLTIIPVAKIKNSAVKIGGDIQVEGYGFPRNALVTFYLDSSSNGTGSYKLATATNATANGRGGLEAKVKSEAFDNPHTFRHVRWEVQGMAGNTTTTYAADPAITLSPYTGRGGESILVTGSGFTPGVGVGVTIDGQTRPWQNVTVGTVSGSNITPNSKGYFTARFTAPAGLTAGSKDVAVGSETAKFIYSNPYVVGGTDQRKLEVLGGASGVPGTKVTIRGTNYASFEPVGRVRFDSVNTFPNPQLMRAGANELRKSGSGDWQVIGDQVLADVNGVFEVSFKTPVNTLDSVFGPKYINTEIAAAVTAVSVSIANSGLSRSPRTVSPGSTVRITGRGYTPDQNLGKATVTGFGALGEDIKPNANGVINATFKIPDKGKPGVFNRNMPITNPSLAGGNDKKDLLLRNTQRIISVSPKSGGAGTLVRVKADGLWANRKLAVRFDNKWVTPYNILASRVQHTNWVISDAQGKVDFYFNVPPSDSGQRQLHLRSFRHASDWNKDKDFDLYDNSFRVGASIAVRPVSGKVDDDVTVTGTGFAGGRALRVNVGGAPIAQSFTSNADGSFNAKFKAPEVPGGTHTVTVSDPSSGAKAESIYKVGPTYKLSGDKVGIGGTLTVHGMGMKANSPVTIHLGNGITRDVSTNAQGSLTNNAFVIGHTSSHIAYTARLVDSDGNTRIVGTWHVNSKVHAPSVNSGKPGDEVTFSLEGFVRFERVEVKFGKTVNDAVFATDSYNISVGEDGSLTDRPVKVPNLPPGDIKMFVIGRTSNSQNKTNTAEFPFKVLPYDAGDSPLLTVQNISNVSTSTASPGDIIRISVPESNTFTPGETVTVTYDVGGTPIVRTLTANANGAIPSVNPVTLTVPGGPGGMKTITAVGKTSGATRTTKRVSDTGEVADFTVVPKVSLAVPSKYDLGDQVTIEGTGAGANETLQVWIARAQGDDDNKSDGVAKEEAMAHIDSSSNTSSDGVFRSASNGTFKLTFRVLNVDALYKSNPQPVRIRVKSVGSSLTLTSSWFGRSVQMQMVAKGVRVSLRPTSEGPGDVKLTLDGIAADSQGRIRAQENIGNVELAHGSIQNGARQKVKKDHLKVLVGLRGEDSDGFATISTNAEGRFQAEVELTKLNGGKPMPSGLVTIYVGGELVTTSYTVKPELRLTDADNKAVSEVKLDQDYTLKGISFGRSRAVTLTLGDKAVTTLELTTDGNGEFSTAIKWAPGGWVGGPQTLRATTQYDTASLPLTVLGTITGVTAGTAVNVGDSVEVSGHGYGASEPLTITVGGNAATATEGGTTNADGTFTATITIPAASAGAKDLRVESETSDVSVAGAYAIGTSLTAEMSKADTVTVAGTGYPAGSVTISVAGESPATATAGANGSFTAEIALTGSLDHGSSVTVTAGSQTASFLYDDTAEAQDIMVSPNPAGSGKTVTVSANIEAGSTAAFSVAGVDGASGALEAVEGGDAPDGFTAVAGTYAVADGADIADAAVTVTVTDSIGNEDTHDGGTLTIDTVAPTGTAALSSETTRNNLSFTITATSEESGLTATADVSGVDTTKVDQVALAESDAGGSYSADVMVSGANEAAPGDKMVVVTLTDAAGNSSSIEVGIELRANTAFTMNLHVGLNLIHVPVNEDGLDRASDLYKKINNGADLINAIVMLKYADDPAGTPKFVSYTGGAVGSAVDLPLEDSTGVLVLMKQATSVTFTGGPLNASVLLRRGINLIGVPRDGDAVSMASHIAAIGQPNVALQTLALTRDDDGNVRFISVTSDNDVAVTGGQGFIVVASGPWALPMPGDPWENAASTSAAVSADRLRPTSTPLLVVEGSLAREDTLAALNGLEVSVTNLRTGQKVTERVGSTSGNGRFSAAMIDLKGGRYEASDQFEVQVVDPSGAFGGVPSRRIVLDDASVVSGRVDLGRLLLSAVPETSALLPNYPNPFNPETWIPFQLADASRVTVTIYNAAGQTVRVLELGQLPAGTYHSRSKAAYWDGRNALGEQVASGVYFCRIEAGSFSQLRRMAILK